MKGRWNRKKYIKISGPFKLNPKFSASMVANIFFSFFLQLSNLLNSDKYSQFIAVNRVKVNRTRKSCSCETAMRMLKSWMGISDHAKKAENCENLAESYLLKFQKVWKVILKGPGAGWRQKTAEKRRKMQNIKVKIQKEEKQCRKIFLENMIICYVTVVCTMNCRVLYFGKLNY